MNQRFDKIKQHVVANKPAYIAGISCLTVGVLVGAACKNRPINFNNTVAPIFNNTASPVIENANTTTLGGYAHKLVRCNESGQIWETLKEAADSISVSPSTLSKHVNGHTDHVYGSTFSIVGLGTH
jgi:hypothetical protein